MDFKQRYNEITKIIQNCQKGTLQSFIYEINWDDYIATCASDMKNYLDHWNLRDSSFWTFEEKKQKFQQKVDKNNLKLNAEIKFISSQQIEINFNLGILLALDDLYLQACCSHEFLSETWDKGGFMKSMGHRDYKDLVSSASQVIRYYDYNSLKSKHKDIFGELILQGIDAHPILCLFSAVPAEESRRELAEFLSRLSFLFLMMHEEAHYIMGHLHYYMALDSSSSQPNGVGFDEEKGFNRDKANISFRKLFEFQADHNAAESVIDLVFQTTFIKNVPHKLLRNPVGLFRLIVVSIGTVCLILEKAKNHYNRLQNIQNLRYYPTPQARLINSLSCLKGRYYQLKKNEPELAKNIPTLNTEDFLNILSSALLDLQTISIYLELEELPESTIFYLLDQGDLAKEPSKFYDEYKKLNEIESQQIVDLMKTYRIEAMPQHAEYLEKHDGGRELYSSQHVLNSEQAISDIERMYQDSHTKCIVMNRVGKSYLGQDNLKEARYILSKALTLSEQIDDKDTISSILNNLGEVERRSGNLVLADKYYSEALFLKESSITNVNSDVDNIYNNLGLLRSQQGKNEEAIEFLQTAIILKEQNQDCIGQAVALDNIANIYCKAGRYYEAIIAYRGNAS